MTTLEYGDDQHGYGTYSWSKPHRQEIEKRLKSLRVPASLFVNGEQVGGMYWSDGHEGHWTHQRPHWCWWYDPEYLRSDDE